MSYKNLEIWQMANDLVVKIHRMTLTELPPFELYEEGSQIRRSSKSAKSLIVEGYGRRAYKQDFIRFLINSIASNDETVDHLENLYNTKSLKDDQLYYELHSSLEGLGRKINKFIQSVELRHNELSEPEAEYIRNIKNEE
jgi:four helix bundle protein